MVAEVVFGGISPPSFVSVANTFKYVVLSSLIVSITPLSIVHSMCKGILAILIPNDEIEQFVVFFSKTLVRKFFIRRPNLDLIIDYFHAMKLCGTFSLWNY